MYVAIASIKIADRTQCPQAYIALPLQVVSLLYGVAHTLFTTSPVRAADKERKDCMVDGCSEACLMKALTDGNRRPQLPLNSQWPAPQSTRIWLYSPISKQRIPPCTAGGRSWYVSVYLHQTRVTGQSNCEHPSPRTSGGQGLYRELRQQRRAFPQLYFQLHEAY